MTTKSPDALLPPVERDEGYDRTYIPLPGGWEIQTKGKGSSFRICDTKSGERWNVTESHLHEMLERMAHEVRAASHPTAATPASEGWQLDLALRAAFFGWQRSAWTWELVAGAMAEADPDWQYLPAAPKPESP